MQSEYAIRQAGIDDIEALVPLINSAYRGEEAKKGWTHEADLIAGTVRIDDDSLLQILQSKDAAILTCSDVQNTIVGCVYLENQFPRLYLGMLSVKPALQGG